MVNLRSYYRQRLCTLLRENFFKTLGREVFVRSIKNEPVVYVSSKMQGLMQYGSDNVCLQNGNARLQNKSKEAFKINEVWEWNESERNDGFNRFVNLRGAVTGG